MGISMDKYTLGLNEAIKQAKLGLAEGGIPIGAALVVGDQILGAGHNMRVQNGSPILHGETSALNNAGRLKAEVYRNSVMYTTLSPCIMCTGTILLYGIPKVVIGENVTYLGEEELLRSRGVEVVVLQDATCIKLMQDFITAKSELWLEDIAEIAEEHAA